MESNKCLEFIDEISKNTYKNSLDYGQLIFEIVKDFYSTTFISSFLNTLKLEESRTKKENIKYFVWKFKKKIVLQRRHFDRSRQVFFERFLF